MATYTVTGVRMERARDGSHEHIVEVRTSDGARHNRRQVVESMTAGNVWAVEAEGQTVNLEPQRFCPRPNCAAAPYFQTHPTSISKDNIENLDRF